MSQPNNSINIERHDDLYLIRRIAEKDERAFQELHGKYINLIYSTVLKVVSNQQDAQDVVNEVLIKIWKSAHTYRSTRGSLTTWICTTSRNKAIDHLRKMGRQEALKEKYTERIENDCESNDPHSGWKSIVHSDTRKHILSEMEKLPREQKDAVDLVYLQGLTQKQAAEKLQQPLSTVKARIRRALISLKDMFDESLLREFA